jgi:hypothetical protein
MFLVPGIPIWFMAFGVGLLTPVPYPIAYALIGGLSADSVVKHPAALDAFPEVKLIDFDTAAKDALEKTHPSHIERVWDDGRGEITSIKHEGCFIDYREVVSNVEEEKIFCNIAKLGAQVDKEKGVGVQGKTYRFGNQWMEWRVRRVVDVTSVSQTVFFCPRGMLGFLYWYLFYPFHVMKFRGLIKAIVQRSKTQ